MKNTFLFCLLFLLSLCGPAFSVECDKGDIKTVLNESGDISCFNPDGWSYTRDSQSTRDAKILAQKIVDEKREIEAQKSALEEKISQNAQEIANSQADGDDAKVAQLRIERSSLKAQKAKLEALNATGN